MSNAKVSDALSIARSILGDDAGAQWSDPVLFPKVVQAHGELVAKLILNGLSVYKEKTARLSVTIGATDLGLSYPGDVMRILKVQEVAPGDGLDRAIDMTRKDDLPDLLPGTTLRYWSFNKEKVSFLAATVARDIVLTYLSEPVAPTQVNSVLDFKLSEIYIGPRVAALAVIVKDKALYQAANQMAEENLSKLVRTQVKSDQSLPVRRRPFSYMNRRGGRFA